MKRKNRFEFPAKKLLMIMIAVCVVIMICGTRIAGSVRAVNVVADFVVVPMQEGINIIGGGLAKIKVAFTDKNDLVKENEELNARITELESELLNVQIDQSELNKLRALYEMDSTFNYQKLAATVISKDSGNWFSTFVINVGSNDGVEVGMNVIADGGLCGVVTDVGHYYSKVRSIIDDTSNVSAKDQNTEDLCIVNGNLMTVNEDNAIPFENMQNINNAAAIGDMLVTSNISDVFLSNIPIGYIVSIENDPNNLTRSGTLMTITDFAHLDKVFVILQKKDKVETFTDLGETPSEETIVDNDDAINAPEENTDELEIPDELDDTQNPTDNEEETGEE